MDSARTRRLLIVEDDEHLRRVMAGHLAAWWDVAVARDGESGLERFRDFAPDAVVSDWVMPGLHGEEFLKALRLINPAVPIVVMTGKSSEGKLVKSVGLACAYVKKPMPVEQLNLTLERCIKDAQARQGRVPHQKGHLRFCRWKQQVSVGDAEPVTLTAAELQVFMLLWEWAGQLVTQSEIARAVSTRSLPWNADATSISRRFIHQLRQKLEPDPVHPQFIITVRGQGVKLVVGGLD